MGWKAVVRGYKADLSRMTPEEIERRKRQRSYKTILLGVLLVSIGLLLVSASDVRVIVSAIAILATAMTLEIFFIQEPWNLARITSLAFMGGAITLLMFKL